MNYTLVPGKDGKEYLTIMDHSIVFNTSRAYYDFKNLFGGNNALGKIKLKSKYYILIKLCF